ncbi:thioredoxin domain-containing protein [Desulfoferrobacter suflitae]|uniref:thioredoxin domain-containing protein n=1 Tax=Desulfoferrobacter suflitae TaxID=2865782 RepID=UPI0021649584|nr:thioredoxin domain-containing protein [Desulfoferrobacter suflitae]MCK8603656.1 thioredoxin domain-containing protein [Desulfoferrobacter suflitae]
MNSIAKKRTQNAIIHPEVTKGELRVGNTHASIHKSEPRVTMPPVSETLFEPFRNRLFGLCLFVLLLFLCCFGAAWASAPLTVDEKYPHLATGILRFAELAPLEDETLLAAGDLSISREEIMKAVNNEDASLRRQLESNLFFVLEQEAARRVLVNEAKKKGISAAGGDDNRAIQALFESVAGDVSVSDEEAESFYRANKEMVGGAPFEQVKDGIRQYLLQDKRQQAVTAYVESLTKTLHIRVNQKWVEAQNRMAMDNPVDKARSSGKATMVEFGAAGCVPCDKMQPILDKLRKDYPEKLNVVFVHVREEQILAARYGIRSIPVQAFFDADGEEVFRHVGFFPEEEVLKQLSQVGVAKQE